LYAQLAQPNFSGLGLSKQLSEGIAKIGTETAEQRRNCQRLIQFTIEFFRAAIFQINGQTFEAETPIPEVESFSKRIASHPDSLELLGKLIDRAVEAAVHVDQTVAVPMVLDSLFDDLARFLRETSSGTAALRKS
jgi:hypothetical protein